MSYYANDFIVENKDNLISYLQSGEKPKKDFRIGTECEKIPFFIKDFSSVPYFGDRSISAILKELRERLGWTPILDAGNIIGLYQPGGSSISIEPGGQLELSSAPFKNLDETAKNLAEYTKLVDDIAGNMGINFLSIGVNPLLSVDEVEKMPKSRYSIMRKYMPKVCNLGLDMMFRTATVQVNLDYYSEIDMRKKMQISMKLQPLATALFASSPFALGKDSGYQSLRASIWRGTDPSRTGLLPFVWSKDFGYADYVNWALGVNMYFIIRDGKYIDCTSITFEEFLKNGYEGHRATLEDFIDHLSTVFPEVRLKTYIEMRGSDAGPKDMLLAKPAFWVGLLYDDNCLDEIYDFVSDWGFEEVNHLLLEVSKSGLEATFRDKKLNDIAKEILAISKQGLLSRQLGEEQYLLPLERIVDTGRNVAQIMLDKYYNEWQENVSPVFEEYKL